MKHFGRHGWLLTMMAVGVTSALALQLFVFRGDAITNDENSYLFQAQLFSMGRAWARAPRDHAIVQFPASMINLTPERWFSRYSGRPPVRPRSWCRGRLSVVDAARLHGRFAVPDIPDCPAVVRRANRTHGRPPHGAVSIFCRDARHAPLALDQSVLPCALRFRVHATSAVRSTGLGRDGRSQSRIPVQHATVHGGARELALSGVDRVARCTGALATCLFRQAGAAALAGLVGLGAYYAYNSATTGDWRVSPYSLYSPDERPGFVEIRGREHTPERGLRHVTSNARRLNHWWFGFNASFLILIGLAVTRWKFYDILLVATALSLVAGYFFFYFGGVDTVGPVYYFEGLLALSLLAARSVLAGWQFLTARIVSGRWWKAAAGLGIAAWTASLGIFYTDRIESWSDLLSLQRGLHDAVAVAAPTQALVLMEVPEQTWFGVRYDPREPLDVIYVRSRDDREAAIVAAYPDRQIYRYRGRRPDRIQ